MLKKDVLIIHPSKSTEIKFNNKYNKEKHWLLKKSDCYDLMAIKYNDGELSKNLYDYIFLEDGQKFNLLKKVSKYFDFSQYKYIGYIDDDIITDTENLEESIRIAKMFDLPAFQISLDIESQFSFPITIQDKTCDFAEVSFIEMMCPFFRIDKFKILIDFLNKYEDFNTGHGIDIVFKDLFQSQLYIIHRTSVLHPFRESSIDKNIHSNEVNEFLQYKYSSILKNHFNRFPIHKEPNMVIYKKFLL